MNAVTLDWDNTEIRAIQGSYRSEAAVFENLRPVPAGLSTASSIGRAEGESKAPRHRPQLEPPRHYMLDLLHLHQEVEGTVSKELVVFKAQSSQDLAEIERLEKEKNEALKKNADEALSRNSWSILTNVAQYLTAGASIAIGISLGGWGLMIAASGVVGFGNRLVRDTVGWQSIAGWFSKSVENQKRLVQRIEMGFLLVELGTGLAGGAGACWTGAYSALAKAPLMDHLKTLGSTVQSTGLYVTATSKLGKEILNQRMADLKMRMSLFDAQAERIRMEMNHQVTSARDMINMAHSLGQEMHKAIAASEIQEL